MMVIINSLKKMINQYQFDEFNEIWMNFSSFWSILIEFRHYWTLYWPFSRFLLQILMNFSNFLKFSDGSD